ncbi:MAG TPA: isochorismatase family cysteine hydrolase [Longimicrobiales bacterium]
MTDGSHDLHGSAPDASPVALLLIDVINDLEFPGAEELLGPAVEAATAIRALSERARAAGIPVIYANDNFGRWRSDFRQLIDHVRHDGCRGKPLADLLAPHEEDYFVLKPKHSAFYATTLDTLLQYLGAKHLIITGLTTDMCVLFTASDAFMRDFRVHIPPDCVAEIPQDDNAKVLDYMARVLDADLTPSPELDLEALLSEDREERP